MGFTQVLAVLKSRRRALFAVWGGVVLLALLLSGLAPGMGALLAASSCGRVSSVARSQTTRSGW